jgi:protein-L-isoaspartate(D-aspartate) O-methyltransferase
MTEKELAVVRRAYAKQIMAEADRDDPRLEAAFATVRREDFLGPGPWMAMRWGGKYRRTPSADPVYLYTDSVFGIIIERHLNNGQPSSHAMWMAAAVVNEGDHAVHIGTGTGYYTAILAHLAGLSGRVTGIEIDSDLAARAQANLAHLPHVMVVGGNGATQSFDPADVIYVNAGVTRPLDPWLDGLAEGGRLLLPLTTDRGFTKRDPTLPLTMTGAVFLIQRRSPDFLASWISPIAIIPAERARDAASEAALSNALQKGGWDKVTRLYRGETAAERCWLQAPGWALAYD